MHSLLILELCVCEIFSSNIFLLGHKGCRLVHSIPNLLNSSVSWAYISLCAEQVPAHKQDSEEQHTIAGTYLSCPPLPASCSANMANTFLFCLCNQHRRTQCVCSVPTPFFPAQEVPVISVHTGSNAFWALSSNQSSENLDECCNLALCHSETKVTSALILPLASLGDTLLPFFGWVARVKNKRFWYFSPEHTGLAALLTGYQLKWLPPTLCGSSPKTTNEHEMKHKHITEGK